MSKFQTISLSSNLNTPLSDSSPWAEKTAAAVASLPIGSQVFWGVPFEFSSSDSQLMVLNGSETGEIKVAASGTHVVFAHLCDERASTTVAGQAADYMNPVVTAPGEHLADYVVVFADGTEHIQKIRRRFEINQVQTRMQSGFSSRQHQGLSSLPFRGPYPDNACGRW